MQFRTFAIILLILSSTVFAQGRKPAVEDFVGIEIEDQDSIPAGSESLYNLEKDIQQLEKIEARAYIPEKKESSNIETNTPASLSVLNIVAVCVILGLPLLSWLFMMNHLRRKATIESASNVEVLAKYRKERELNRKKDESYKKAS